MITLHDDAISIALISEKDMKFNFRKTFTNVFKHKNKHCNEYKIRKRNVVFVYFFNDFLCLKFLKTWGNAQATPQSAHS